MFKSKKGFIMHPLTWIVIAFIVGFLLAYLIGQKIIPLGVPICKC